MNINKTLAKFAAIAALLAAPAAFAGSWVQNDWSWTSSLSGGWTIEVPSTALTLYSRAGAYSTTYWVDQGGGNGYYQQSYSIAQAGVSGPPSGLIHEARAVTQGGGTIYDEKWDYNHPAGEYQVYHGGGTSSSGNGGVEAYSEIDW